MINAMKLLLTSLLFAFTLLGTAQTKGSLTLDVNLNYSGFFKNKDIDSFKEDYASVFKNSKSSKFTNVGIPFNVQLTGAYWVYDNFGIIYDYSYSRYAEQFEMENGEIRKFEHTFSTPLEAGLCFSGGERFILGFKLGVANARFKSQYIYRDGTVDMNYNSPYNGVYSAFGFSYKVDLLIKVLPQLYLTASYGGVSGSEYSDKNFMKGIDNHALNETIMFPSEYTNYASYIASDNAISYPYDSYAKLKYSALNVGLTYHFYLYNNE